MMLLLFTGGCAFSDILGDLVCDEVFGGSALFVASIFVPQPLQNFCPGLSSLPQFGQITFDSDSVFSDTGSADSIFAPHLLQNFNPSRISFLQLGHIINIRLLTFLFALKL